MTLAMSPTSSDRKSRRLQSFSGGHGANVWREHGAVPVDSAPLSEAVSSVSVGAARIALAAGDPALARDHW